MDKSVNLRLLVFVYVHSVAVVLFEIVNVRPVAPLASIEPPAQATVAV